MMMVGIRGVARDIESANTNWSVEKVERESEGRQKLRTRERSGEESGEKRGPGGGCETDRCLIHDAGPYWEEKTRGIFNENEEMIKRQRLSASRVHRRHLGR